LSADWNDERSKEAVAPSAPYGPGANGWENGTIGAFLERAAAWAEASQRGTSFHESPSNPWRRCAHILLAAKSTSNVAARPCAVEASDGAWIGPAVRTGQRETIPYDSAQPGDPTKAAAAILRIAGSHDPPLRLLLGSDAVRVAEEANRARIDEDEKWRPLSVSTDFVESP
jgi:hypothetical protein